MTASNIFHQRFITIKKDLTGLTDGEGDVHVGQTKERQEQRGAAYRIISLRPSRAFVRSLGRLQIVLSMRLRELNHREPPSRTT